jgi:hypothetical protein
VKRPRLVARTTEGDSVEAATLTVSVRTSTGAGTVATRILAVGKTAAPARMAVAAAGEPSYASTRRSGIGGDRTGDRRPSLDDAASPREQGLSQVAPRAGFAYDAPCRGRGASSATIAHSHFRHRGDEVGAG